MSSLTLKTALDFSKVAVGKKHTVHLLVNLIGAKHEDKNRKPLSLSVAIDCSGSMAEENGRKIEFAKRSLLKLIDHLTGQDTLGVVGFSDSVWTVFSPMKMTAENKEKAKVEVERLHPLQSTNLSGATLESFDQLKDASGDVVRAMLFTDGLPTAGITDKGQLVALVAKKPEKSGLTCFGYGNNHDPELLASMAKKGGGNFYFVKTPDDAPAFFGRELGGLLSCVAQNVKVKLSAKKDVKLVDVLNDFDVDANKDQTDATITVDDVYAEEKRRILIKVELPEVDKGLPRPVKIIDVEVNYHDLQSNEPRRLEDSVSVEYVKEDDAQKDADKEVQEQLALIEAARAQEEAIKLADAGNFQQAQVVIQHAQVMCRAVGTKFANSIADDLAQNVAHCLAPEEYKTGGGIYVHSNKAAYRSSRPMTGGTKGLFSTPAQDESEASFSADDPSKPHIHIHTQVTTTPKKEEQSLSKRRKTRR